MKYILIFALAISPCIAREWSNKSGKTITADFGGLEGDKIVLILKKKTYRIPLDSLTEDDQSYAKEQVDMVEKAKAEAAEKIRTQGYPFAEISIKPGELKTTTLELNDENKKLALKGGKGWKEDWIKRYSGKWLTLFQEMAIGYDVSTASTLIGLPNDFDPAKPTTIFIQWTSGDSKNNIKGARTYWKSCNANNWILLSVDSSPDPKAAWSYPVFLANVKTALDQIHKQWPGADQWPIVCGGFSGGAKNTQIMAGLICQEGFNVKGLYMGGCNEAYFEFGSKDYNIKKATWRKLKAFESSGTKDHLVADTHRSKVKNGLKSSSLKDYKTATYEGGHSINHQQFVEAVKWILQED